MRLAHAADIDPASTWLATRWRSCPSCSLCGGIVLLLLLRLVRVFDRSHLGWDRPAVTLSPCACSVVPVATALLRPSMTRRRGSTIRPTQRPVQRPAGLRSLHHLPALLPLRLHRAGHLAVAADRHPRPRGLGRLLRPAARGDARHGAHGVGEPSADGLHRRRDGQLAELRPGRLPQGPTQSSEAALKYVVYGGGAAGVMLYGISLLAGQVRHRLSARPGRRLRACHPPAAAGGRSIRCCCSACCSF